MGTILLLSENETDVGQIVRAIRTMGLRITGVAHKKEDAISKINQELPNLIVVCVKDNLHEGLYPVAEVAQKRHKIPHLLVSDSSVRLPQTLEPLSPVGHIHRPFKLEKIVHVLKTHFATMAKPLNQKSTSSGFISQWSNTTSFKIIGKSKTFLHALSLADKVAKTNVTVQIQGETGSGKEVLAKYIHLTSLRKNQKLIAVNCASLPENLIESQLFGHEKGAFTDAASKRIGKFELAENSTIFLDEIGELSLTAQAKILRFLQEKEIDSIGGTYSKKLNVRIIAATNKNLSEAVKKGEFRADLYFRLAIFPILVPPLRKRKADIIELAYFFLERSSKEMDKQINGIDSKSIKRLLDYTWPGNIRELEHCIVRGVILCNTKLLEIPSGFFNTDEENLDNNMATE